MARLHNAVVRWDDSKEEMSVIVGVIETEEEYNVLMDGIENDPQILALDSRVWYYFDEFNPNDPISDYYKENNGTDFVLVSLSEDYDTLILERKTKNDE